MLRQVLLSTFKIPTRGGGVKKEGKMKKEGLLQKDPILRWLLYAILACVIVGGGLLLGLDAWQRIGWEANPVETVDTTSVIDEMSDVIDYNK